MNKKLSKLLSLMLLVGFMELGFAGCLSAPLSQSDGDSMNTTNIKNKFIDIAYAEKSGTQKLDIYLPDEGNGPFPVIIAIHSGGFSVGSKNDKALAPMLRASIMVMP